MGKIAHRQSLPFHIQVQRTLHARTLIRETLCESGRCIDALKKRRKALEKRGRVLKKRGRVLKKRGRVLEKVCLVSGTGGGQLLQKRGVAS